MFRGPLAGHYFQSLSPQQSAFDSSPILSSQKPLPNSPSRVQSGRSPQSPSSGHRVRSAGNPNNKNPDRLSIVHPAQFERGAPPSESIPTKAQTSSGRPISCRSLGHSSPQYSAPGPRPHPQC